MKTLVSALMISAAVFSVAAHADDSTVTRAQVVSEMHQAQAAGLISRGEADYPPAINSARTKSRSEVQAELAAAVNAGQISTGEQAYPSVAATGDSSKTRAQVKAELFDYVSSGAAARIEA